jgi:YggT family protein
MNLIIHQLLQLFIWITIADIVLSYVPDVRRQKWAQIIHKIADVPQKPVRDSLPKDIPLDPSPMIVIIIIQIIMYLL